MSIDVVKNVFAFLFGACVGSFLNVCIYRLPKSLSIVRPRSFCPGCNKTIAGYDNIPLVSFLLLGGKCRRCAKPISIRYPIVELLTAILFLVLYMYFGLSWDLVKFAFFFSLLIVLSVIDIDYHAVPASLCVLGIVVGLAFTLPASVRTVETGVQDIFQIPLIAGLRRLIFGFGFAYLFKFFGDVFIDVYLNWRKKESIEGERESLGLGDVDFLGMVSVFMGAQAALLVFFMAPFFALLYSLVALFWKRSHLIPYLPYLSAATVVVFFWGKQILGFIF